MTEIRDVFVIGVGMTKFGKSIDKSLKDLGRLAIWDAIVDSGINPKEIQTAYCGNMAASVMTGQTAVLGQTVLREVGIKGIPITNIENACASGSSAFREAWIAVASGLYDVAMAVGLEKLYANDTTKTISVLAGAGDVEIEGILGITMPGVWAMRAKVHMQRYGTTLEQLAKVSVKNHRNGRYNSHSQYQNEVSVEEVLGSRPIAEPLTLLQCSPIGDGAATAILCSEQIAKNSGVDLIKVAACTQTSGTYESLRDISFNEEIWRASEEAYKISGFKPSDVDFAEVHDCFTIAEIMRCEGLGFCAKGEGGRMIEEGTWEIGGELPVNPSGGLLAKGHPIGATGIAQIAEIVWQFREEVEPQRQVANPEVGLAHCSGGAIGDDTGACTVTILTTR